MLDTLKELPIGTAALLVETVQKLSQAREIDDITQVVRVAARKLVNADGATFVLQERGQCYYADEDAITPMFKGKRFPLESCVSGWSMLNKKQVAIKDIYCDPRVPHQAYRPTFVRSLLMTPVRRTDPIAAIGTYWADEHEATAEEQAVLQTLADTTAVALANVNLYNELEQRVDERTRQLALANKELEAFAYTISHDLKGPLRGIQRICRYLNIDDPKEKNERLVSLVADEAERLADLTDELLRLSRLSFVEVDRHPINVSTKAKRILDDLSLAENSRSVEVKIEPDLVVLGDGELLHALMQNLLSNAWKYTGHEQNPVVEVGSSKNDGNYLTIYIKDNGAGFDSDHAKKLFQPFQRYHSDKEFPGTGIGLATVKRIATMHGGDVRVESKPGNGATFYVTLPLPKG